MANPTSTQRFIAALIVPALLVGALAMPAAGKKSDPAAQSDPAATTDAADTGQVPTPVPPDETDGGGRPSGTPGTFPNMPEFPEIPGFPGFWGPDEVGVVIEPVRLVTLVQECASISVAGLSVAAHNCANGLDVVGSLPPGAPWTVFTASHDGYTMAAPTMQSGPRSEIKLPFAAEPLRRWVREETGVRLRRERP
jgi:hypothetical protein